MTAQAVTYAGRAAAAALMVDECLIERAGTPTFNPGSGAYESTPTELYRGCCRVRHRTAADAETDAGDRQVSLRAYTVSVPISVTGVTVDDLLTVTGSALDADLVGLRLRVVSVTRGSHVTARRLSCEEVTP